MLSIVGGAFIVAKYDAILPTQHAPTQHAVKGTLQLSDVAGLSQYMDGETCSGSGGYADVAANSQVTVFNDANDVVGTSRLSPGKMQRGYCIFIFSVDKVPDSSVYQIEVGAERRGKQRYSRADAERSGYEFGLSLGDGSPVPERSPCPSISDIVTRVKLSEWSESFDPNMSFASFAVDVGNQGPDDVGIVGEVTGEVVATFANGKTKSTDASSPPLGVGQELRLDPEPYVKVPTSWGKPTRVTVKLIGVAPNGLCK